MIYRFNVLAGKVCMGFALAMIYGTFTACTDDYDLDDEGNYPKWLGGSIYETLKNPSTVEKDGKKVLTGTFTNYLQLIDDLQKTEDMSKTGSVTIFPANDEAFERFYQKNPWNVTCYEELTTGMKKQLLYTSMLDNAILVEMLSNISKSATSVTPGQAMKHLTGASSTDVITHLKDSSEMPANNSYWKKYYDTGINIVKDATTPMMVHFTEDQMTSNGIQTRGENSDFEVITGTPYDANENSAYIFRIKIISPDITCKNGYIHQMADVIVPPGNLAELIRTNGESNLFSRMLDRFSAPYYSSYVTNKYNFNAQQEGLPLIDAIYEMRYISSRSHNEKDPSSEGTNYKDPNDTDAPSWLPYDPGWNEYTNGTGENSLKDIAAMFVPTDEALEKYFLPGGEGEFLITAFGKKENTKENLEENIDSIPLQNVQQLIANLMKSSFVATVPSKFGRVMDEANDPIGLTLDNLNKNSDGTYDVKIANNGVAYMLKDMFAPPSLIAVSAPLALSDNMKIMNKAVVDGKDDKKPLDLGLNYYAYLLAMSANYGFFIPTDDAFGKYYVDPAYLGGDKPRALKFYYTDRSPYVYCSAWDYNPITGEIGDSTGMVSISDFKTQLTDILNYHTIVLPPGTKIGDNGKRYYKTKHGGAIRFDGNQVSSGSQIEGNVPMSNITHVYNQKNGVSYSIDHVLEAPRLSVLNIIQDSRFSEFYNLCNYLEMDAIMEFASDALSEVNQATNKKRMEAFHTFTAKGGLTDNVNYFNSYNYTVYAPDNDAMQIAYNKGLPTWDDIKVIYDQYIDQLNEEKVSGQISDEVQAARDKALAMVNEINSFIRYHFQDNSIYADKVIEAGDYPTACSDSLGMRSKLNVSGGNDIIIVKDNRGQNITIDANSTSKIVNKMTREYVIDNNNHSIKTSSFAVVHQISSPLNYHNNTDRYDDLWTGTGARKRLAAYRKLFNKKLINRY